MGTESSESGEFPAYAGMRADGQKADTPIDDFKNCLQNSLTHYIISTREEKYLTLEDLVIKIHEHPVKTCDSQNFHRGGIIPLYSSQNADGKKRIIFGVKSREDTGESLRDPYALAIHIETEFLPRLPKIKDYEKEFVLIEDNDYKILEEVGGNMDKRKEFLRIVDPDATAEKLYKALIPTAIRQRASDIHIEPAGQNKNRIRFRIDGVLVPRFENYLNDEKRRSLVNIAKVAASIDISEKRLPQDGGIRWGKSGIEGDNSEYSLRISTVNTNYGEKAVLRILRSEAKLLTLNQLGYPVEIYTEINDLIKSPNGIILVTGPTGSGKTTTLYSILNKINSPEVNIMTIEDPIEMGLEGINQTQVNQQIGYNFANGLRAFLRQDPNIIFVGEIRDYETAEIAISAAKTGHLVFSTLHTNDSIETLLRLQDLKINKRDLASCLKGVISQRLLRKLCPKCKEQYNAKDEINQLCKEEIIKQQIMLFKRQSNLNKCSSCQGIGYFGRTVVPELWMIGNEERALIEKECDTHDEYLRVALSKNMKDLMYSGVLLALDGTTSLEEVLRVVVPRQDFARRRDYLKNILEGRKN